MVLRFRNHVLLYFHSNCSPLIGALAAGGSATSMEAQWAWPNCIEQQIPMLHLCPCDGLCGRFQSSPRDTYALGMCMKQLSRQTASQLSHRKQRGRRRWKSKGQLMIYSLHFCPIPTGLRKLPGSFCGTTF